MSEVTIRRADVNDCELIRRLAEVVFPATYRTIITQSQIDYMMNWMYSIGSLRSQMQREGHIYNIAFRDSEAVGYVSVQRESERLFHLHKIYVMPDAQGSGIGAKLFAAAVATIKQMCPSACRVELNVNRENSAVGFYERLGMHRASEGDFDIGDGFFMRDYIMAMDI